MPGIGKPRGFVLVFILASVSGLAAQETAQAGTSPTVAARLNTASSVFLSDAKGKNIATDKPYDDANRGFYAAMKGWNRYHFAATAADADLIFQLSREKVDADLVSQFPTEKVELRLTILDPKTHAVLETLIEHVESALFLGPREKNLNKAVAALVDDLRHLAVQPAAPAPLPLSGSKNPKLFLSNVGSDNGVSTNKWLPFLKGTTFAGGPGQPFKKFYGVMQSSGQYDLVGSPAEADFILEMRYLEPHKTVTRTVKVEKPRTDFTKPVDPAQPDVYEDKKEEEDVYHPQVQLVILDPKTLAVQGAFTERVETETNPKKQDKEFSEALNALVNDAGTLLGRPPMVLPVPNFVNDPPAPTQIRSAKTVFIANAAGTGISGGTHSTDHAYNEFYAIMKNWGRYQLSSDVSGTDLLFEISTTNHGIRLAILDPRTRVTLWSFTQDVGIIAFLKSDAQGNFDGEFVTLVQNIAKLAGQPVGRISVPQAVKDAPVPAQITAAKKVFIANAGGESLSGGTRKTEQAYNDFYATMKSWGRYELTPTAAEADLVFQISFNGLEIQLAVLDPKSQALLWEIDQRVHWAFLSGTAQKNFTEAMASLVKSTAKLSGQPAAEIAVPPGINIAPVPSQISGSGKVFLSRPRVDSNYVEKETLGQLYNQIYADIKSWGHYELTSAPGEADLIFEPSLLDDSAKLAIRDAKTGQILFTWLESGTNRRYSKSAGALMDNVRRVASLSAKPSEITTTKRAE